MASHFKQPGDERGGKRRRARTGGSPHARLNTRRGGDESYHAPEGNPHAAGTPTSSDARYIPVVSAAPESEHGRRRGHFAETDPYDLSGRRSRDPKKRVGRIVSIVLFVVGLLLILAAGGMWVYNQWRYHEQDVLNERLAAYAEVSESGSEAPKVDWASLKAAYPDVVGWIQIPGTVVNYPVLQGENNERYLWHDVDGNYVVGGQIFLDYANTAPGMVDGQSIIYGHHLANGSMFKTIDDMDNQELFDSISTVWYVTEDATYELEPLFAYKTVGTDTNARQFTFESTDALHTYLSDLLARAVTRRSDAEDLIANATNVLTLCTCNYDQYSDDARTLLVCVPKPTEGE